jgi:hypothetical protein
MSLTGTQGVPAISQVSPLAEMAVIAQPNRAGNSTAIAANPNTCTYNRAEVGSQLLKLL